MSDGGATLIAGRYVAAPASRTDGQAVALLTDAQGRPVLSGYDSATGVFPVASRPIANSTYTYSQGGDYGLAAAMTAVAKSSSGLLLGIETENASGVDVWVQVWNRITVPTSGVTTTSVSATPLNWLLRGGTSIRQGASFFGPGWLLGTGIVWAFSTRKTDFTVPAAGTETALTMKLLFK